MTSYEPRGTNDLLLNPDNTVLTLIDYQPMQINSINSMNRSELVRHSEIAIKLAKLYNIPIIHSTVNVKNSRNQDTIPRLRKAIGEGVPVYDRTTINAWEDKEYREAIKQTGRKKILMLALWTEACLTFPTLVALSEGFEVYPIVDAVGGTSPLAHETALRRVEQAGAQLISLAQLGCELQRDWNRKETVPDFVELMAELGAFSNFA
ncbi:isochorismatase family protein [Enterococcus hulanensis]|uniref:Isochorismatase family protein n=1 Tax=Enterococcus hulanensis TaxID=2559929 RepID=A0ABU3F6B5_9ENTE|nr:isochorismatase family protein [Enterococcus hulanensis]MDT2601696.1 isochorismatase family protein [Enterococcus hulanensis]MDT2609161.1 isochorismatase family protein [Enterococcus hulanensis]MDT2616797.1 isochorismatase family protein [Enterococcus hulanensis]MDT2629492.1 isochorismatase family protein [Enterococcus hulanensis]MDT2657193.1 isochorismatase family protein [Enterococcus hulanensis]